MPGKGAAGIIYGGAFVGEQWTAVGDGADQWAQSGDDFWPTCLLHAESRVASALGQGFYTIGPCGEELLSSSNKQTPFGIHGICPISGSYIKATQRRLR